MKRVLFICKQGPDYLPGFKEYFRKFSGLFNSARKVSQMLNESNGIMSVVEVAKDNNSIDALVSKYKPDLCIIEAYWVVPEKFEVLHKLHPDVKWIVRIHSELPFWSTEGVAIEWTLKLTDYKNVILAPNSVRLYDNLVTILDTKYSRASIPNRLVYLPNYYPADLRPNSRTPTHKRELHIGCFGAIRPLKNQLIQAVAAIRYADSIGKKLYFHINGNRSEQGGDPVLKNIKNLFKFSRHDLVLHDWQPHGQFLHVLNNIDIGMQVSYTESFNIVAADLVTMGKPLVTSSEISWVSSLFYADPNDVNSIVKALGTANSLGIFGNLINRTMLCRFVAKSKNRWLRFVLG